MEIRSYAICQTCFDPYPESRGCPGCHGDELAAREIAEASAIAHAAESPDRLIAEHRVSVWKRRQAASIIGLLSLTLVVGIVLLVLNHHF